ncbi:hypothetical protein GCM10009808_00790 [Microbacterium sediminicola]|uniref:Uncharacterized protein n=1 Tax=Microbacterium sediminicola TaxID=415210 RepID=A0ABN2HHC6_9MICO
MSHLPPSVGASRRSGWFRAPAHTRQRSGFDSRRRVDSARHPSHPGLIDPKGAILAGRSRLARIRGWFGREALSDEEQQAARAAHDDTERARAEAESAIRATSVQTQTWWFSG